MVKLISRDKFMKKLIIQRCDTPADEGSLAAVIDNLKMIGEINKTQVKKYRGWLKKYCRY